MLGIYRSPSKIAGRFGLEERFPGRSWDGQYFNLCYSWHLPLTHCEIARDREKGRGCGVVELERARSEEGNMLTGVGEKSP